MKQGLSIILFSLLFSIIGKANEIEPIDSIFVRAEREIKQRHFQLAIDIYTDAMFYYPENIDLVLSRARAEADLDNYENAFEDIHTALQMDQANPKVYYLTGELNRETENIDGALSNFRQVLQIDKEYIEARFQIIELLMARKEYAKALNFIDESLKQHLTSGDLYSYKAQVLHAMLDYRGAMVNFDNALLFSYSLDSSKYFLHVGQLMVSMGELLKANEFFNNSLNSNPYETQSYYARGIVNYQLGNFDAALEDFNTSLELIQMSKDDPNWQFSMIADTLIYDVVVKNPYPEDIYMEASLKGLRRVYFVERIVNAVLDGRLIAYDYYTDEPMTGKDIKKLEKSLDISTVGSLKFEEQWFFDENTFTMEKRVKSIVLGYELWDDTGYLKGYKPYFKVKLRD